MVFSQLTASQLSTEILYTFLKVIIISVCGAILAKRQTLKPTTAQTVYNMAEYLYLPCLVFASFITSFNLLDVYTWLPTFILTCIFVCLEVLFMLLLGKFVVEGESLSKILVSLWGVNLIDPLSLSFLILLKGALNSVGQVAYSSAIAGSSRAINYLLIYSLTSAVLRGLLSKVLTKKIDQDYSTFNNELQVNPEEAAPVSTSQKRDPQQSFVTYMLLVLAAVAIVISLISPVKNILVEENSFVYRTLTETITRCGYAAPALLLIQIGSILYHLKKLPSDSEAKGTAAITIAKCVVFPLICFGILQACIALDCIKDPITALQLLVSSTAPLSLASVTHGLVKKDPNTFPRLYMAQYALSIVSMSGFSYWFLTGYV